MSNDFKPLTDPFKFRMVITLLLIPAMLVAMFKRPIFQKANKLILVGVVVVGMFFNAQAIYSAFPIVSESKSFPIGPPSLLSHQVYLPFFWRFLLIK